MKQKSTLRALTPSAQRPKPNEGSGKKSIGRGQTRMNADYFLSALVRVNLRPIFIGGAYV